MIFTMEEIRRFPQVSRTHFLECSGNTQNWGPPAPDLTVQDTHGLISCCEWTGVWLKTVLNEIRVKPEARWMLAEGADAAAMTRSIPIEKVFEDALLAYSQNGERLRPEQGYPLRLLLPGYEGNTSVKWLRRLKFGDAPWQTREETSKYSEIMPDGTVRQFNFVNGDEIGDHVSIGRSHARRPGLPRDFRDCLVGTRKDRASRSQRRWRDDLGGRRIANAGPLQMPHAVPVSLALVGRAGDARQPRDGRKRICSAQSRGAPQVARRALLLPLQRDSDLERRRERRGDQCRLRASLRALRSRSALFCRRAHRER